MAAGREGPNLFVVAIASITFGVVVFAVVGVIGAVWVLK